MKPTKGEFIKAIALAAILLALLAAMVPSVSAVSKGDNFNYIGNITTPQKVLIGQNVQFNATEPSNNWANPSNVVVYRYVEGDLENTYGPWSGGIVYNVNWSPSGAYYASDNPSAPQSRAQLSVQNPSLPLILEVGTVPVSTIAVGTPLRVDTGGINLFDEDKIHLVIMSPDGQLKSFNNQIFTNITVAALKEYGSTDIGKQINTTGWKLGDYTFQVNTKWPEYACGLSAQSAVKGLTITKGEINISAEKTSCVELQTIKITVTGGSSRKITVRAFPLNAHVIFPVGVNDNPPALYTDHFNHTIDEDSTRNYAVYFNDTGIYTIKVIDWGANGVFEGTYDYQGVPYAVGGDDSEDTVDITVAEKAVTFDVPTIVVIGEKFTIRGTANTGTYVDIAVDDYVYSDLNDLVIDANKQFSKEIDTAAGTDAAMAFKEPRWVRLKAFIDRPAGTGPIEPTETEDGSVVILLVNGSLVAELSSTYVALGDDFTVSGTARGSKSVDIVIVSPKGSGGTMIDGTAKWELCPGQVVGIYLASASVSEIDHNFSKEISAGDAVDTGQYLVAVLSRGSDSLYGKVGWISLVDALCTYSITGKTQDEILAILQNITAESDDLLVQLYIEADPPYVKLNPIASVKVGEPLVVTGTSNRMDGFAVVITVKGPKELTPQVAKVEKGVEHGNFSATFDTTGASVGTYIVKADDGDGHTDEATVEIVLAVATPAPPRGGGGGGGGGGTLSDSDNDGVADIFERSAGSDPNDPCDPDPQSAACLAKKPPAPTPAPTIVSTPIPIVTPTPTISITPTPITPEEKGIVGFEAVFAVAGLLAVAYLVLVKKRK